MAITKIHAIKSTLALALAYIENPEKTKGQMLVSGYNTDPQLASVEFGMTYSLAKPIQSKKTPNLAYHLIQSFAADDDVTPERAHELGRKLAAEYTEGKYEYVVATHVDHAGQIHNHIMINAVSFYDHRRLHTVPYRTASQLRSISDRLCAEADLSVIENPRQVGQSYAEYLSKLGKTSFRQMIRQRLDFILEQAHSYDEFLVLASELGITVDDHGKQLSYKINGAQRPVRSDSFHGTDKYLLENVQKCLHQNAACQQIVQAAILTVAQSSSDAESFSAVLEAQGIKVRVNKRTGAARYFLTDSEEDVVISEAALDNAWKYENILDAIARKDFPFAAASEAAAQSISAEDRFAAYQRVRAGAPDTLVQLATNQIERMTAKEMILRIQDKNGVSRKITIDRRHIVVGQNGSVSVAIGAAFNYFHGAGSSDFLSGEDLIRQMELANNVRPRHVSIPATYIKHLSVRGVTLALPGTVIERLFIPAEYVQYDKIHGYCTVDLYEHWHYSFAVSGAEKSLERRNSLSGQAILDELDKAAEYLKQPPVTNDLRSRIRYVERKSRLQETALLAKTLFNMSEHNLYTAQDFNAQIADLQIEIADLRGKVNSIEEKNKQYGMAARALQTCQSYLPLWQSYMSTNHLMRKSFRVAHQSELDAFDQANALLEKLGVDDTVDPQKVLNLIGDRMKQIDELNALLEQARQEREELLQMQANVAEIQHSSARKEDDKVNEHQN